ncbi:hypothetical protein SAY86_016576 [Trapa natans]|uniref:Uncharacterized protein n=1 Tax=Trapa natans TaxID=22666 RepID=A0AAN7LDW7_TRANT|nr:hypothetical protein SAY86_016576 [Trapa natans]
MDSLQMKATKENGGTISSNNESSHGGGLEARQKAALVEWLNSIHPNSVLPLQATDEQLRAFLLDGSVFCHIMKRLRPNETENSSMPQSERVGKFLKALAEMGIPQFELADLEKGSMNHVIESLLSVRMRLLLNPTGEKWKDLAESKWQRSLGCPVFSEPSAALVHHSKPKIQEVFQLKHGQYAELPPSKITEMMKSITLDNAPAMSLLSVVNGILDESVKRKDKEVPQRVACLLRKVVQEIERRMSTQAEHLRTQNNIFKVREEKYKSKIKVLEALAEGTPKVEKEGTNEKQEFDGEGVERLMKEKESLTQEILALKQELEVVKKMAEVRHLQINVEANGEKMVPCQNQEILALKEELEVVKKTAEALRLQIKAEAKGEQIALSQNQEILALKQELEVVKKTSEARRLQIEAEAAGEKIAVSQNQEILALKQELEVVKNTAEALSLQLQAEVKGEKIAVSQDQEILALMQELEFVKKTAEAQCLRIESETKGEKTALEEKAKELECQLTASRIKLRELETFSESKNMGIKELEHQLAASVNKVKELEMYSESKDQGWKKKVVILQSFTDFQLNAMQELRLSSSSIKQKVLETQRIYSDEFRQLGVGFQSLAEAAANYHGVLMENRKLFNEIQDLKGNIRVYCRIRPFLSGQTGKQTIVEYAGDDGELIVANPSKQGKEGHRTFRFNKVYGPTATQANVYSDIQPFVRSVLDGYNVCIFAYGQTGSGKTYTMTGPNMATKATWGVNYRALNDLFQISEKRRNVIKYEIMVQMIEIYNEQIRDLFTDFNHLFSLDLNTLGVATANQSSGIAVPDASMHSVRSTSDVLELMDVGFKNRAVGVTAMNERSSRSHSILTVHTRGTDLKTGATLRGSLHLVDLAGSERVDRSEVAGDRLREAQHINKSLSALGDVIFALSQKSAHVPYRNSKLTQVLQSSLGGQAKTLMFIQLNPDTTSYTESLSTLKFAERASGVELGAAKSSKEGKEGRDVRELMDQVVSLRDTITKREEEIERLQLLKDLKNANPDKHTSDTMLLSPSHNQKLPDMTGSGQSEKASSPEPKNSPGPFNNEPMLIVDPDDCKERTSNTAESMEAETEGMEEDYIDQSEGSEQQPDNLDRLKQQPGATRPSLKSGQALSASASLKVSSGVKKPATGNSSTMVKPSRRWQ